MDNLSSMASLSAMFGLKIQELNLQLQQATNIIKKHNLSVGQIGEDILRSFLKKALPERIGVTQGFIEHDNQLSRQCDIIIYDKINYAPLCSFGQIEVIPVAAVLAVIEVKVSLDKRRFGDVLDAFEVLTRMGIQNKYIFSFKLLSKTKTLEHWFHWHRIKNVKRNEDFVCGDEYIDNCDFDVFPTAIVGLEQNVYLAQNHVQTDNRDMLGYLDLEIVNDLGIPVSCLQSLVASLLCLSNNSICVSDVADTIKDYRHMCNLKIKGGFGLCDL